MPWYNSITGEHVYSPSDDDKQRDELVYRPSIYAKEELPTWAEVYEEFYLNKQFMYDQNDYNDQTEDSYWKIPHKKFLMAVVCNQFNKMLYEDLLMSHITEKISKSLNIPVKSLQFIFGPLEKAQYIHEMNINEFFENVYEIYTIPLPTGKQNPFIVSKNNRVDVSKLDGNLFLFPIMDMSIDDEKRLSTPNHQHNIFNKVIDIMIEMYKEYFEGDVGWKDSEGKLIKGDPGCRSCTGAGYDVK